MSIKAEPELLAESRALPLFLASQKIGAQQIRRKIHETPMNSQPKAF